MSHARKAVIIGYPVAQARSPLIHQFWLKSLGINGSYERAAILPGEVEAFLRALPEKGFVGGNVTIPHKEEAFRACEKTTERAKALRAVNTFWFEGDILCGDNTDGLGFVAHLDQIHPGWDATKPSILILGAGGAARGLVGALLERLPSRLTITNRSADRLNALLADIALAFPDAPVTSLNWDQGDTDLSGFDLIINTTSLGMTGKPALEFSLATARIEAIVADIIYVPLETPLLMAANRRKNRTLDGLGMLLHQAVPGFERWFGVKPEVTTALRNHILADLISSSPETKT